MSRKKKPAKRTKIWTTKNGRKIRVCDMEDSHLINTIRLLERHSYQARDEAIRAGYSALSMMQGEMAIMAIEQDISVLESDDESMMPEIYFDMLDEANDRQLDLAK